MGTTYLQGFKERCDQRIKILNIKVYFQLLASVPLGLTLSFVRSALRPCDPRNSDWIVHWSVDCVSLWIIRFFNDGGRNSIFYESGSTCGTWCPQSKTDVNVKRESKHVGVSSNLWQEKARKIWHFLHLCWRITLDGKRYSCWILKTERGSRVSSNRFDETSVQPLQKCWCLCGKCAQDFFLIPIFDEKRE